MCLGKALMVYGLPLLEVANRDWFSKGSEPLCNNRVQVFSFPWRADTWQRKRDV